MEQFETTAPGRGFTLIEILIVVVILGLLSSIVIPQFTNATGDAERTTARSQLNILRGQLGMYWVTHGASIDVGRSIEDVVSTLDGSGLLSAPVPDPDQENNNEIMLPGDFAISWDRDLRVVSVSEGGTPTGW